MWRGLYNSGIKTVIAQSSSTHFHCSVAQVQEIQQPRVISKHVWMLLCKGWLMKRHGVLCYRLMFQSTLSSLVIQLTSSTWIWTQGIGSVCHQYGPGTCMWISFLLYKLENCLTHREPENGPCSCGAVEVKVSLCSWPAVWIEIRGGIPRRIPYLSFLFASTSLGKILLFPQWGWKCVWTSGSFPSRLQRPVCQFNHQEKLSVIPADQTAFTFQWLSQTICGIGNIYLATSIPAS